MAIRYPGRAYYSEEDGCWYAEVRKVGGAGVTVDAKTRDAAIRRAQSAVNEMVDVAKESGIELWESQKRLPVGDWQWFEAGKPAARHASDCICNACKGRRQGGPTKNRVVRLPDHVWNWLKEQPGGSAVAIEQLVIEKQQPASRR